MTKKKYFFTVVASLIIVILILVGVVYYVSPNLFEKPAIVKTDSGINPGGGDVPDSPPSISAAANVPVQN